MICYWLCSFHQTECGTRVFLEMSGFADARCNEVIGIRITSVVRSAINDKLLVDSHDDVEKQAKVAEAFFK